MTIRAASSVARALSRPVLRPPHTHVQCRRRAVSTTAAAVPVALGLDFGTESVRAVLVSLEGTEVGSAVRPFDHGVITGSLPGGSTTLGPEHVAQHAGDWVECAGAAVKEALARFVGASKSSSQQLFIVPPSLPGLQGEEAVDVQIVSYKATSRAPPPPPPGVVGQLGEVKQITTSAVASLTLRVRGSEVRTDLGGAEPILFTMQHATPLTFQRAAELARLALPRA